MGNDRKNGHDQITKRVGDMIESGSFIWDLRPFSICERVKRLYQVVALW
jgi:hypothetical protein